MDFKKIIIFLVFCLSCKKMDAVIISHNVEVHLSIEDASLKSGIVTEVTFDREKIDLSEKTFMHPVLTKKFEISPGKYEIEWKTEKSETPWGKKKVDKFKKMIEFEVTDTIVYIKIRGESFSTY